MATERPLLSFFTFVVAKKVMAKKTNVTFCFCFVIMKKATIALLVSPSYFAYATVKKATTKKLPL
jgi:hypothetical protein